MDRFLTAVYNVAEKVTAVALFLSLISLLPLLGIVGAILCIPDDIPLADVYYDAAHFIANFQWVAVITFAASLTFTTAMYCLAWVMETVLFTLTRHFDRH